MVPDSQKTSVGMEYFCTEGDDIWTMSDAELIDMACRELSGLGLAEVDDIEDGFVVGYGLDCDEQYRNLHSVCVLNEEK